MFFRRTRRGVSFLEVTVAVIIAVILAGAGAVAIGPRLRNQRVQSAADTLQQELQKTQLQAIRQAQPWTLIVDTQALRYASFAGTALPAAPDWSPLPPGIRVSATQPNLGGATQYAFGFDDQGFATGTGSVTFGSASAVANELQAQVEINQLIGTVEKRCLYANGRRAESCT